MSDNSNNSQGIYRSFAYNQGIYGRQYPANMNGPNIYNRPQQNWYVDQSAEDKEEMDQLRMTLRKAFMPQIESLISYVIIPLIGAWFCKLIKWRPPVLPTIVGVSLCRTCKWPLDVSQSEGVKIT